MRKTIIYLFLLINLQCSTVKANTNNIYNIIPMPVQLEKMPHHFELNKNTSVILDANEFGSLQTIKQFTLIVAPHFGLNIQIQNIDTASIADNSIVFFRDNTIENNEGYELYIRNSSVLVKAKGKQGFFYAIQTIAQLLPAKTYTSKTALEKINIPGCVIKDYPRFVYRGMHLDVCRHFFPIEFIKRYIDLMAFYKYNTFHWHLTDDQGWRIEIKKYPKLTSVGSVRKETTTFVSRDKDSIVIPGPYSGFYTQEQIKEVVQYAQMKNITIIPEIEMPGHSLAALAAYPEYSCTGGEIEVGTRWGVFSDVYCPYDTTFTFLQDVLTEVMQLFPSTYIHIGGDECPKEAWKNSEFCQVLMKKENLKDEMELQSYFIKRIEKFLSANNRKLIGWDEILEGGLSPNATVMSWRGVSGGIEAASQGHDVVMTPGSHCYFDHYQYLRDNEPYAIGGFTSVEKVYNYNPIPTELESSYHKHILGAQCNVWTEYIDTSSHVEYMVYPRACALSEVLWSMPENKNYESFLTRLSGNFTLLDAFGVNYAKHVLGVYGKMEKMANQKLYYVLETKNKNAQIRYTTNGKLTAQSPLYTKAIPISNSFTINAATYKNDKRLSNLFTQTFTSHIATGAEVLSMTECSGNYNPGDKNFIVNAISGSSNYGDGQWFGYWGNDCSILIDLGSEKSINQISINSIDKKDSWIHLPAKVSFSTGVDTADLSPYNEVTISPITKRIHSYKANKSVKARYIKASITNFGEIPAGFEGAGNKAWLFVDELIVK
ncbi:MAG: family 20 glycosylhydrolase [Bacteroidetes bacterium]|nr:family 20 glycosylhydrolase [Bacteroidota bacterium]